MSNEAKKQHAPKPDEDEVDIRAMRERNYLGAHSMGPKGKAVMVIERVEHQLVQNKGSKKGAAVMYFVGCRKGMVLNATAEKTLFSLFPDPSGKLLRRKLIGQKIGLYSTVDRMADGKQGPCLRVWPKHVGELSPETKAALEEMASRKQDAELAERQETAAASVEPKEAPIVPEIPTGVIVEEFPS